MRLYRPPGFENRDALHSVALLAASKYRIYFVQCNQLILLKTNKLHVDSPNTLPSAFAESVTNVRILAWILLGALHTQQGAMPVPIACSNQMADYIHFVLAGFADQSKVVVVVILSTSSISIYYWLLIPQ
jgi:hypothetical protein